MENVRLVLIFLLFGSLLGLYQNWNKESLKKSSPNPAEAYSPLSVEKKTQQITAITTTATPEKKQKTLVISSSLVDMAVNPVSGDIVELYLKKYHNHNNKRGAYALLSENNPLYRSSSFIKVQVPGKDTVVFKPSFNHHKISHDNLTGSSTLLLTGKDHKVNVEAAYTINKDDYVVEVKYKIANESNEPINPFLFGLIQRDDYPVHEQSRFVRSYFGGAIYTRDKKFDKITFSSMDQNQTEMRQKQGWCGLIQHYFVSAWIPDDNHVATFYAFKEPVSQLYTIGFKQDLGIVQPNATRSTTAKFYAGPQEQNKLASIANGLELVTDYGWATIIAQPLFKLLSWIHLITANWGWAIILLTILIKIVFLPLSATSYKSMAKMKILSPKIQALKSSYGNDKTKQQKAIVELFQKENVNPAAGCLPIIIQVPVFISLYYVLSTSVEILEAPWLGWIKDLSSPDPLYVLPIALAASTFLQTKMNPPASDPVQAKIMTIMPMVFSIMFFFFPSGLVLYWLTNNLLSILQQFFITRKINEA
ncbi:membrane protein insertase YidC [Candidatus Ichthyocystis hellenicum]|uniref:membrane protein insertase YidC n=1 Tax=Candidatus Ichthyocystis hellenicum TaxID=1561003 RepID=UPI000AA42267|nr:membrane protein insertase YidC [Candidatus Ichthyocystis hellenicum]